MSVEEAADQLSEKLFGHVPHVVGVFLRRSSPSAPELELYVYIDSEDAITKIPRTFRGHSVHVQQIGTPRFAAS